MRVSKKDKMGASELLDRENEFEVSTKDLQIANFLQGFIILSMPNINPSLSGVGIR